MITLKNKAQISRLRDAGKITGEALLAGGEAAKPGVSTHQIDTVIRRYIREVRGKAHISRLRWISGQCVYLCK